MNYALSFDGINDYVSVADSSSLRFGTNSFSIALWIKGPSGQSTSPVIIQKYSTGGYNLRDYTTNHWYWRIDDDAGHAVDSMKSIIFDNTWHFITLVVDRSSSTAYAYTDGILDGPAKNISIITGNISPAGSFTIAGTNTYFNGSLDEVRIYNRALSATEVFEQSRGIFKNETGLVMYLPFDENTGTTAYDKSSYGNNGTLTNGPTWTTVAPWVQGVQSVQGIQTITL